MIARIERTLVAALAVVCWPVGAAAQVQTEVPPVVDGAKPVAVERISIDGASLEGNLEGDAVDREALVLLPPSYATETSRRYPVIYALHGYSIGAEQWAREIHVPQTIEGAFAQGAHEMIVVLPDSKTAHNGSMYVARSRPATSSDTFPRTWSPTSTRTTGRFRTGGAAGSSGTRWAATARRESG